jgi:2-polyprenyl-3-methyl-5-hydroxy-6-metoxy-1,4-benzoquinol methylase
MTDSTGSIFHTTQPTAERYLLNTRGFGTHQAMVALVRKGARVLDVGCADGSLGAVIRRERDAVVIGLESDPDAGAVAATVLDDVVIGDIRDAQVRSAAIAKGPYDQIVLGDVLEHTTEPDLVLRDLTPLLTSTGGFVISLPNVLTLRARARLMKGVWRYEDAGIFDRTHLRFFSVASAREMVDAAGLDITRELDVGPLSHRMGRAGARLTSLRPGLLATQIVVTAEPRRAAEPSTLS